LSQFTQRQVRVVSAPLATVTELVFEALGHPMGSPAGWTGEVLSVLEPCDMAYLGPVFGAAAPAFIPECLIPPADGSASGFDDELDRMAHKASQGLQAELHTEGLTRAGPWAAVAQHPQRWLDGYLTALGRVWQAIEPRWIRAGPLLEREAERVGTSLARGGFTYLMAGLSPRGRVDHDRWYIRDGDETAATISPGLVLLPMLIGPDARLVHEDDDAVVQVSYPLPGIRRLITDTRPNNHPDPLSALLGAPRADILRRIDQPTTAGQLAADMVFTPSAITHHLDALERAQLTIRERHGRHIIVHRTARGTELLNLYEP